MSVKGPYFDILKANTCDKLIELCLYTALRQDIGLIYFYFLQIFTLVPRGTNS